MTVKAFFKLIRFPNLLLMAFTMYCCRHFIIIPILNFSGSESQLSHINFFLAVISVLLIAAGGYVINDYYDVLIDEVNKPAEIIVGKQISEDKAYLLFHFLSFCGILIAFYLSFFGAVHLIGYIHLISAVVLWLYAAHLKKLMLVGNLLISLLCALPLFLTAYYDYPAYHAEPVLILIAGYSAFAFLLSLIREMIKDLEDIKGDLAGSRKTLAVVAGPKITRNIILFFIFLTMGLLVFVQLQQIRENDLRSMTYVLCLIQLPLAYLSYKLLRSNTQSALHYCSTITKLIMLAGVLSMPVFYLAFR
jgi:4-hydroxybenzoate polyprenyltransferase